MALATNPFVVLSYVSGPAILTNAAALMLLSTSNRFARAVDRSRALASNSNALSPLAREELLLVARRVRLIARAVIPVPLDGNFRACYADIHPRRCCSRNRTGLRAEIRDRRCRRSRDMWIWDIYRRNNRTCDRKQVGRAGVVEGDG
jgi:hypothetical protein